MHPSTLAKRGSILLFLAFIAFYFYGLGQLPFIGPDEPRYAEVARGMFARHDWISPTLGGYLWFEKPVLLYWLIIGAFKIAGVSEAAARSAAAICGLLTVAAVFWIGKQVDSRNETSLGFWSALIAGTSAGIIAFSRAASFDIVVTATIGWALAFYFVAELAISEKRQRRLLIGFYISIGLSLLAKGLVGVVIPFGIIGVYYTLRGKPPARDLRMSLLWGVPVSLLIAATWYGPMIWKHGSPFLVDFIIKHHFQRYATNTYHHPGPIYYYLLVLPGLALPWTAFLFDGVWKARKAFWRGSADALTKLQTFALAWIFLPLIFFSFSGSKLPGYILPALPAAALLIGLRLGQKSDAKTYWAIRATGALALLLGIGVMVFARQSGKLSLSVAITMAAICGAVAIVSLLLKNKRVSVLLIAVAALSLVALATVKVAPRLVQTESTKDLIQIANDRGYGNLPVFGLQRDDRTPEFYAAGRVIYGEDREPVMYDGVGQVIYESHTRAQQLLFLIPISDLDRLRQAQSVRADPLANNGRVAIVLVTPL